MPRLLCFLLLALLARAGEPQVIKLWPGEPPGPAAKVNGPEADWTKPEDKLIAGRRIIKLGNVSTPEMHVFFPTKEKRNGAAVVICPGGGFNILAWDLEGTEVAEWLNSLGFVAAVLKYRVPTGAQGDTLNAENTVPLKALGPVIDTQRALSLVRARAAEWQLEPARLGVLGFSAGGATAGHAALLGKARAYAAVDGVDEASCAADFALLIYPAYLADKTTGALKPHLQVTKDVPPMFLAMTQDDPVDVFNCLALYSALTRAKVAAELHLWPKGGHGYGLRETDEPVTRWPQRAAEWLARLPRP
jgi:acetyl esterase/lipase